MHVELGSVSRDSGDFSASWTSLVSYWFFRAERCAASLTISGPHSISAGFTTRQSSFCKWIGISAILSK